jgi:hypothetical protein
MKKIVLNEGDKINNLTFLKEIETINQKRRGEFLCYCGNKFTAIIAHILHNRIKSCSCFKIKHDANSTPEYRALVDLKSRCLNPKNKAYKNYGGRGIKVCDRWLEKNRKGFLNFLEDVGYRPSSKHSLDRFPDNDGNYEPGNCRWATKIEQANNKRNNITLSYNNEALSISEWSRKLKINKSILRQQLFSKTLKEIIES